MLKFARLKHLWDVLRASFWFVPIVILVCAIGAAIGFVYLDSRFDLEPEGTLKYIFAGSTSSARTILSIIAGAMIGVAGTVFSITLVALTLATSQFGPRLLRNFMYDRLNQVVLGSFVSTFVYCLIVLNSVKESGEFEFIPVLAVFGAILGAIVNIVLLIVFIHHVAVSIQADEIISDISASLSRSMKSLFPKEAGHESIDKEPDIETMKEEYPVEQKACIKRSGYIQSIDNQGLIRHAADVDLVLWLHFRPGQFVVEGEEVCRIYGREEVDEKSVDQVASAFIVGDVRTPLQDAEYAVHQMVEIATRALSPGVNDPYTAIACIDNLSAALCSLTGADFPHRYRSDEEGNLRVVAETLTFNSMLDAAFNQIRHYAEGNPAVVIRLIDALSTIYTFARKDGQRRHIERHAEMVYSTAKRSFTEPGDLNDFEEKYALFMPDSNRTNTD